MSSFADQLAGGLAAIRAATGTTIVYQGEGDSITIENASKGRSTFQTDQGFGILRFETTDWMFAAASLVLNGIQTTPARGHKIIETIDAVDFTYDVSIPGGTQQAWGYSDPGRTQLRVNTVLVANS